MADTPPTVLKVNGKIGNVVLTTSDINEGSNLYYTSGRFDSAFATKSTTNLTEGSNLYFTNARAVNACTGNFEPLISSGTTSQYWRGDKSFQTLNTLAVPELTNLYYTQARFDSAFSAKTTDNLTQGATNKYYSSSLFNTDFASKSTTNLSEGTNLYYTQGRFDSAFSAKTTTNLTEGSNLYYTQGRFDSAFAAKTTDNLTQGTTNKYYSTSLFNTDFATKTTTNLTEGSNLYYTQARFDTAFGAKTTSNLTEGSNLYFTNARAQAAVSATSPLFDTAGVFSIQLATALQNGYLSASDWNTFNNKLSKVSGNYITNPDAEIDVSGWNLYNDAGRTVPASVTDQDITYTSALSGGGGNGATVSYTFCGSSYIGPVVTCPSGTAVQVCWYNGPTLSQNPTATVLKAAYDAQSCATAIATSAITGTASKLQYITGTATLSGGGDTSPVDGTGGVVTGVTFTRNTSTPLVGVASFDLGKDANSRLGSGVSTDFTINSVDKNTLLQISFVYQGSSGMVLGNSSDAQVFIYDIGNATLIPVKPKGTIAGPVSTAKTFVGTFTSTTSSTYRLIVHIASSSTTAWDLLLDSVTINDQVTASAATQVPSVVIQGQPISGAVTDHMVVMWTDSATQWVPATVAGAAIPVFGTDSTMLGFATNIVGSVADIYVKGFMDGFSFGPFLGYEQYIDTTAGNISPLPSPFTDLYVRVGKGVTSTGLNIDFSTHVDLISNGSGVPIKGGLLTSSAVNDATGDLVLNPGANNTFLVANSAAAKGLNYRALVSADVPNNAANTTGSAATLTTSRTIAGTGFNGSANIALANKFVVQGTADAGLSGPQFLGALGTGIVKNTTTTGVLSIAVAGDFPTLNQNTSGSAASFTGSLVGDVTGTQGATVISAATVTGKLLTGYASTTGTVAATDSILIGIEKLNGNSLLKANTAAPSFTGDVNSSTGNVLISTIGKGLQVKTGANSKIGQATLAAGTVTVANTSVTANSRIFLTVSTAGGTQGFLRTTKSAGTSFTITSTNNTETSVVDWIIIESIP